MARRCLTIGCKAEKTNREKRFCSVCEIKNDKLNALVWRFLESFFKGKLSSGILY